MKVVIAGGSGFIGEALVRHLIQNGHDTAVLTRNPEHVDLGRPVVWDGKSQGPWTNEAASADALINLAGDNLAAGRWTASRKRKLIESRVEPTRALVEAMKSQPQRKRVFVSASAVGYYGSRGEEELTESSSRGEGFLAELVSRWEDEARAADNVSRLVILRFGVVIGRDGGALKKMLFFFRMGVGGRVSSGRQWMSWIAREDVARIIEWAMTHEVVRGVQNASSPNPVRNHEFTTALGRALHRPTIFPVPGFVLKALYGQMAEDTLLTSQRVIPARPEKGGFRFDFETVDSALQYALRRP
jgi:uncharacterized protein